ncbi:MAG: Lrp/AsnC family transcriptional regulator [Candidatus Nanoarchaeia archaeon]|nr:Lrp/AsnC family transcriptional regulator [Candidatus Nanoarchaeia archaeon]
MIDKNIIKILSENSELTTTEIAKKLNQKRNIIDYKIKKLYNNKIIKNQYIINFNSLNLEEYIIFLKINKFQEIKKDFFNLLKSNKNVRWFCETYPYYNIRISILINKDEKKEIINEILEKLENNILDKEIIIVEDLIKPINYGIYNFKKINKKIIKDEIKLKIIEMITKNPDIKKYEISNILNQSYESIRLKFKELYEENVIYHKSISFDKKILNLNMTTQIIIKTNLNKDIENRFINFITKNENIGRTRQLIGSYNFEITIHSQNQEDLLSTINNLQNLLKERLISYQIIFNSLKLLTI